MKPMIVLATITGDSCTICKYSDFFGEKNRFPSQNSSLGRDRLANLFRWKGFVVKRANFLHFFLSFFTHHRWTIPIRMIIIIMYNIHCIYCLWLNKNQHWTTRKQQINNIIYWRSLYRIPVFVTKKWTINVYVLGITVLRIHLYTYAKLLVTV